MGRRWIARPGGVGQSLMSHLAASAFGDKHQWVDTGAYFDDHEMRKQADLLVGAPVVTGQESPEPINPMREDPPVRSAEMEPPRLLPPDVVDVDTQHALPTLVAQVLPLLHIGGVWPSHILGTWMKYASNAEEVRDRIHRTTGLPAKRLLLRMPRGGAVPDTGDQALNGWSEGLSASARFFRWVAVSQPPELHDKFMLPETREDWPENSTFAYFWRTMEDCVLAHMEAFILNPFDATHFSLHADGPIVNGEGVRLHGHSHPAGVQGPPYAARVPHVAVRTAPRDREARGRRHSFLAAHRAWNGHSVSSQSTLPPCRCDWEAFHGAAQSHNEAQVDHATWSDVLGTVDSQNHFEMRQRTEHEIT